MKQDIEWHKACLGNRRLHLQREKEQIEKAQSLYDLGIQSYGLYNAQIELAEKENKGGFDRDVYAIKKLCI